MFVTSPVSSSTSSGSQIGSAGSTYLFRFFVRITLCGVLLIVSQLHFQATLLHLLFLKFNVHSLLHRLTLPWYLLLLLSLNDRHYGGFRLGKSGNTSLIVCSITIIRDVSYKTEIFAKVLAALVPIPERFLLFVFLLLLVPSK